MKVGSRLQEMCEYCLSQYYDEDSSSNSWETSLNDTMLNTTQYENQSMIEECQTLRLEDCDQHDQQQQFEMDMTLMLARTIPQIVLAFIAILVNSAEIYLMRKRKLFPAENLLYSLCIADLMFSCLVCTTMTLSLTNNSYNFIRHFSVFEEISSALITFSIFASVFHVVSISLDRLFAVSSPLRHRATMSSQRMKKGAYLVWLLTLLLTGAVVLYQYHKGDSFNEENYYEIAQKVVSSVMFISAGVISIIYVILTRKVLVQARFVRVIRKTQRSRWRPNSIRRKRVESMFLATAVIVTVAFLLCNLPYATILLLKDISLDVQTVCQCLLICNSICNPLVYFWKGYWLKKSRHMKVINSADTDMSRISRSTTQSKDSINTHLNIATITHRIKETASATSSPRILKQSKNYNIADVASDIFDIDTISRFRRLSSKYSNNNIAL